MKPEQKKAINRTILKCRAILEKDIENQLITYGIIIDEPWIEKDKLSLTDEQEQIYKNLRDAITKEMKGGLSEKEALISYIREVTYTYLNRLAALRVMEVRGLIEEVLIQRDEYGNRSYGHRNFFEVAREFCKSQSDEGLSYFISLIFNEISSDIGLLFNTDDEYSIISPSNQALVEVIRLLTTEIDEDSWHQDEIIGWIYQYFNEKEKDNVFDRLYNKKEKIRSIDIPAATQLFTPDWIVEWIVNNSLGKLREEIINGEREYKKLEDIKLLDPACGSGHFLVKAYDLFYQYYVEDGYPKEKIPFLILRHNLHGIDIDARAIQLTALILYIKVRTSLKNIGINELTENITVNLVCADAVLLNGERLEKMKKQFENNPTALKMIEIIYEEFTETRLKGSLIQPEKRLIPLIEEYKQRKQKDLKKRKKRENLDLFEMFEEFEKEQEESVLTKSERELLQYLEQIYTEAIRASDINNLLFANEAKKSVRLLNIFMQKYDVVVMNPPYLGKFGMDEKLKEFVNKVYKEFGGDLYSIFIGRAIDFLNKKGKLGAITQSSFMFLTTFQSLRAFLLKNTFIEQLAYLGTGCFEDIKGEKVNSVVFIIENEKHENRKGKYYYLVDEDINENILREIHDKNTFIVQQEIFYSIPDFPLSFWIPETIRSIFEKFPSLENEDTEKSVAISRKGLATGQNSLFIRYHWEIPKLKLKNEEYLPYAKGGFNTRWAGIYPDVINWSIESQQYYAKSKKARSNYLAKYFSQGDLSLFKKEGIVYTKITSGGFKARLMEAGHLFDDSSNAIFPLNVDLFYLLGYLNSKLVNYFLSFINPTLNYQVGDLKKIPIIISNNEKEISELSKENYELSSHLNSFDERNPNFKKPLLLEVQGNNLEERLENARKYILEIKQKIIANTKKIDSLILTDLCSEILLNDNENFESIFEEYSDYDYLYDLLSFLIGAMLGHWEYNGNIKAKKDNILFLDNQLIDTIYEFIDEIFGEDSADTVIEDEIPRILNSDLLQWLIKTFFKEHISKYKNRPIYWHICSPNKTFNALIYYHALTSDTLYKLKSNYLKPMLENIREDLSFYREKTKTAVDKKQAKQFEKRVIELEKQVDDLEAFDKQIDDIIASGYEPDIDQGVLYNIKPLNPILAKKIEK